MSDDLFGRTIKEQIEAELRENEEPYEFEYVNALAYFGLSAYATEEEIRRVHRKKVAQYHTDTGNTSNEIRRINDNYDIIKKYFKHIKWQQNVRDKKVEIATNMENAISTENIDRNLEALTNKLKQIYETFYRRIERERTIAGLNYLYNQYKNTLRQEYKNVLMYYGNIELDPSINTLQEFNNFLINLLNKNKLLFLEELDKKYHKYQNDESYRPLLKIIINLINESKAQVQSSSFINEKIKEDISTNLRTRINKLKENYLDIEGTLKYLQEFFAEIDNKELSSKSKSLLERLNNLQSEEELNQINNEVEPLEQEAKEYERKKEQEEIDNYIKGLISKYNGLIQNASLEELQELTTKLGKICELISKGKSLNKDLKYYQSIETILDEKKQKEEETSKFKINSSGIYIKKNNGIKKLANFSAPLGKLYSYNVQTSCLEEISFEYIPIDSVYLPVDVLEINFISLEDFILNCNIHMEFIGKTQNFIKVYFSYENNLLAITNIDSTIERLTIEEIYSRVPKDCFNDVSFKGKTLIKLSQEEKRKIIEEIQNYIEKNKRTRKFGR